MAADAALVHDDVPGNVAATLIQQVGDPDRRLPRPITSSPSDSTSSAARASPWRPAPSLAQWDDLERVLTVWDTTQAPLSIRNGLAVLLGLPENGVRVVAPDVGGGFGTKIMMFYAEEVLVPLAAFKLRRPVKWAEDRREHLIASNHERGQLHEASIALRADGTILGVRDTFLHDAGAYTPYGIVVPIVTSTQLPGPYRIPNYYSESRTVYTNKVPVSPYRGAGRPHGCFVMERLVDLAAREMGMDRAEIRFKNLIAPDEFPYDVGLTFQDGAPTRYDSGNYAAGLAKALLAHRLRRVSRVSSTDAGVRAATSASAWRPTWRAPASGRTRERMCAWTARRRRWWSPPASARRGRAMRPALRRSWRMNWVSDPTRSRSRPATRVP